MLATVLFMAVVSHYLSRHSKITCNLNAHFPQLDITPLTEKKKKSTLDLRVFGKYKKMEHGTVLFRKIRSGPVLCIADTWRKTTEPYLVHSVQKLREHRNTCGVKWGGIISDRDEPPSLAWFTMLRYGSLEASGKTNEWYVSDKPATCLFSLLAHKAQNGDIHVIFKRPTPACPPSCKKTH